MALTVESGVVLAQEQNRLRHDAVSFPETLAQSVSVMAPAMSAAFITYLAAIKAGGATPLAFLLAMVSCLLIGGAVSTFALRLPSAGSLYTYTVDGLGSFGGFIVGWTYSVALVIAGPAVLAGFAVFTSLVMRDLGAPGLLGQWWTWFAAGVVLYFFLSWFGIEFSTRAQLVFTAATLATLLSLALVIIGHGGASGNTLDAFSPGAAGVSWPLVFGGMAFGILSFTGFETAAVLGEETREPRRAIPRAVIGSVVVGGLFYVIVTYATSIGYGVREATTAWPQSAAGISVLADHYASYLGNWVVLAGGFSALFCGLGVHTAVTRTFYVMGRDGVLPGRLGRTHPRHQTPHVAIVVNLALMVAVAALIIVITPQAARNAVGATPGPLSSGFYLFAEGLTVISPLVMGCYALLSIAGIRAAARARDTIISAGALLASAVAVFGSLYYSFKEAAPGAGIPGPYRAVPIVAAAVVLTAGAVAMALRQWRRQTWAVMGAVFE
ncbi:MAG TPA: APC family permease [Acidimicrobiia bacterium]|jgi:amino acid transporter|nr:APC family permease [Acidimicrobiia bacterium]